MLSLSFYFDSLKFGLWLSLVKILLVMLIFMELNKGRRVVQVFTISFFIVYILVLNWRI